VLSPTDSHQPNATEPLSAKHNSWKWIKPLLIAAKAAVTLLALLLVSRLVDHGTFVKQLIEINPAPVVMAILIAIAQIFLAAYRWRLVAQILDGRHAQAVKAAPFLSSFYLAQLLGQVMPFVAGDALRAFIVHRAGVRLRISVESVVLDRAIALLILFIIALPGVLFSPLVRDTKGLYLPILLFLLAGLTGAAGIFIVTGPLVRLGARWRFVSTLSEMILDARRIMLGRSGLQVVGLYVIGHACSIIVFWILARGQNLALDLIDAAVIMPLTVLVSSIPIAIAGWGVRESFLVTLLLAAGFKAENALMLSLSIGSVFLIASLPGAAIWLLSDERPFRNPRQRAQRRL